jgi:hypothetical protein
MSFMKGKTKDVPQEHKAQLRMLPPDQIDRTRYPLTSTVPLSLDDRARLQYAQRSGKSNRPPAKATNPDPSKPNDYGLNNKFLAAVVVLIILVMIPVLMWYIHMKPPQ